MTVHSPLASGADRVIVAATYRVVPSAQLGVQSFSPTVPRPVALLCPQLDHWITVTTSPSSPENWMTGGLARGRPGEPGRAQRAGAPADERHRGDCRYWHDPHGRSPRGPARTPASSPPRGVLTPPVTGQAGVVIPVSRCRPVYAFIELPRRKPT